MNDIDTVVSIISGLVTIVTGVIGLIRWSDRHSPHTKTKPWERGHVDPTLDWAPVLLAVGLGVMVFVLASQAFGLALIASTLLSVAVALVLWMYFWFGPVP